MKLAPLFTFVLSGLILTSVIWIDKTSGKELDLGIAQFFAKAQVGRCGDCGDTCNPMCGSRRFRLCCLHYMKKKRGALSNLRERFPAIFKGHSDPNESKKESPIWSHRNDPTTSPLDSYWLTANVFSYPSKDPSNS